MEEKSKRTWVRVIVIIYVLGLICQVIASTVTAYVLAHPELGLFEGEESTRINIANFGPTWGIVITFLQGLIWLLMPCLALVIYWRYDKNDKTLTNWSLLIYSGIFAFGTALLLIRFMDAMNDLLWLFFHTSPVWINLFLGSVLIVLPLLSIVLFLLSLSIGCVIIRKWQPRARFH